MDNSRLHNGYSKRYAFIWQPTFSQRQTKLYPAENEKRVQKILYPTESSTFVPTSAPVSNADVEERFVTNRYQHDVDRYLCRKLQIGRFIQAADIEILRGPPHRSLSKPMALVDDRNNASVTRLQQTGNCRTFRGPLNAQQLFSALSEEVSSCLIRTGDSHAREITNCLKRLPGSSDEPTTIVPAERRLM